jgi:hypothetical protein
MRQSPLTGCPTHACATCATPAPPRMHADVTAIIAWYTGPAGPGEIAAQPAHLDDLAAGGLQVGNLVAQRERQLVGLRGAADVLAREAPVQDGHRACVRASPALPLVPSARQRCARMRSDWCACARQCCLSSALHMGKAASRMRSKPVMQARAGLDRRHALSQGTHAHAANFLHSIFCPVLTRAPMGTSAWHVKGRAGAHR